jgi:hypothetical protein
MGLPSRKTPVFPPRRKFMGTVPPPPPPAFEEWRRRYDKGARSMEDLDPAFAGYIRKERRFLAIGRVVLWIAEIILGSLAFWVVFDWIKGT